MRDGRVLLSRLDVTGFRLGPAWSWFCDQGPGLFCIGWAYIPESSLRLMVYSVMVESKFLASFFVIQFSRISVCTLHEFVLGFSSHLLSISILHASGFIVQGRIFFSIAFLGRRCTSGIQVQNEILSGAAPLLHRGPI
jgi:hypothetical protein